MLCSVAFANEAEPTSDSRYLVDAKIVHVPLRNRIVFSQSPKSHEGIEIELKYSNGTVVSEKVVSSEDGYYVNGEYVIEAESTTVESYGIKSVGLYLNEGKIYISYKFFCLPTTISGLFHMLYELF